MQRRLAGCVAGAVLGFCLPAIFNINFGLSPTAALALFVAAGVAFGYVATLFADVFIG
jgi:hypothetical protein